MKIVRSLAPLAILAAALFLTCEAPPMPPDPSDVPFTMTISPIAADSLKTGDTVNLRLALYPCWYIDTISLSTGAPCANAATLDTATDFDRLRDSIDLAIAVPCTGDVWVRVRVVMQTGPVYWDSVRVNVADSANVPVDTTANDTTGPAIRLADTSLAGSRISTSSKRIDAIIKDKNGVSSVRFSIGSDTFPVTMANDSSYYATVTGLANNTPATVTITAIDGAKKRNADTLSFSLTYTADTTRLGRPTNVRVTRTDSTRVRITWAPASKAVKYQVWSNPDRNAPGYSMSAEVTDTFAVHATRLDYWYYVVALDMAGNRAFSTDTVRVDLTVGDTTGPAIRLATPSLAGSRISANSKRIDAIITDKNGVSSVRFAIGSDTFPVTKADDSTYYATVTGLAANVPTTVTITAVDGATARNQRSFSFSLTYDATLPDAEPPFIRQTAGPATRTRVIDRDVTLTFAVTDSSGVDTVYYLLNGATGGQVFRSGSTYQFACTLPSYGQNVIQVIARDKASARNTDTMEIQLTYNVKPGCISNISPADDADTVEYLDSLQIAWIAASDPDGDSIKYLVYYGLSLQEMSVVETKGDSVNLKGLKAGVVYQWFIMVVTVLDTTRCPAAQTASYSFTTKNHPSTIRNFDDLSATVGDSLTFNVTATDLDGVKEYQWDFNGDGTVDKKTISGSVGYRAPTTVGIYKMILRVVDKSDLPTLDTAVLTVKPRTYTITFSKNDGTATGAMVNQSIAVGESAKLTGNGYTKVAWRFVGWATSPTGPVAYADSATYTMGSANVVLHAKWAPSCMARIPSAGQSFSMGQVGVAEPVHTVRFTYDYWLDTTEVTQADYLALMGVNPSYYTVDLKRPVERITWFDAALYCNARSKRDGLDTVYRYTGITGIPGNHCSDLSGLVVDLSKNGYRLPTEAEWEYSCRAGTEGDYYWGSGIISNYAWYQGNDEHRTHAVAERQPNAYRLYDMCGNVKEWCNDMDSAYGSTSQQDPTGPATGDLRVMRGGAFSSNTTLLRSASRENDYPTFYELYVGFRVALRVR